MRFNTLPLAVMAAALSFALASATASSVLAQSDGDSGGNSDAAARLIFEDAAEAFANGEYDRALRGFQQAYELSNRPGLLYNIGTTLDRLRRDREALDIFERYLREVPQAHNRAEIESRVSQLRAAIAAEEAEAAAAEAERQRIEAERLAAEQARQQAEQEARRAEAEASAGVTPILFYSVAGLAVAAGALSLVFGVRTKNLNDDYTLLADELLASGADLNEQDVRAVRGRYNDARQSQTLTNVFLSISGAALVGAVTLIFFTDWGGDGDGAQEPNAVTGFRPQLAVSRNSFDLGMTYDF